MMTSSGMLILCIVFITQLSVGGCVVDVEYAYKVVSDHKGDWFAFSVSTSSRKLVIGVPYDNNKRGSVMVKEGVRIDPPPGYHFGDRVDVNQQFMVVSGAQPDSVYVYESNSPYNLKATFPVDGQVWDVVISDDNTIAVSAGQRMDSTVTLYVYDGGSVWHVGEKLRVDPVVGGSLALRGSTLFVGAPTTGPWPPAGVVHVYNNIGGRCTKQQTIQQQGVGWFGTSVTMYGSQMAVSSRDEGNHHSVVFTYQLDTTSNKWINNGRFTLPAAYFSSYVSMYKDILVATLTDPANHTSVCGYAYKLSKTTNNNNNGSVSLYEWSQIAELTTKTDPLVRDEYHQCHRAVIIEGQSVFIGRWHHHDGEGVGKVFVHDLSNI